LSYLICIETANPKYIHSQSEVADFYINSNETIDNSIVRKIKIVAAKSGIEKRFSVTNDFSLTPQEFTFFPKNKFLEPSPSLSHRMSFYKENALALSLQAIHKIEELQKLKPKITHIITVTCTGLFAPGLDVELINELNLDPSTHRSSINFMGCNAAVLALKQADQICSSLPNAMVLIVCVEICTIHFQKKFTDDYILSNLIFSDGAAAALVSSKKHTISKKFKPHKIVSFKSLIIKEGKNEMAWQLSETGFIMNLTSYVSPLLNKHLPSFLTALKLDNKKEIIWAIHPGGKKILNDFCKNLELDKSELLHSYKILETHGNMSSPTILFVLKSIIETNVNTEKDIFAAAFGPGLSVESVLIEKS
jgi:alpha-pyrone synthase